MACIGYAKVTADGPVGASGRAVAVYSVFVSSGAGGAGSVVLRNGTTTGGTAIYSFSGTAAFALDLFELAGGAGVVFPDGCYLDVTGTPDFVTAAYREVGL